MKHVEANHPGVSREMIVQAFYEEYACARPIDRGRKVVFGHGDDGAPLAIIGVTAGTTLGMITCREMTGNERAYYNAKRRRRVGK